MLRRAQGGVKFVNEKYCLSMCLPDKLTLYILEQTEMLRAVRVSDANFQLRFAGTDYYPRCSTVKLEKNGPHAVPCMNAAL